MLSSTFADLPLLPRRPFLLSVRPSTATTVVIAMITGNRQRSSFVLLPDFSLVVQTTSWSSSSHRLFLRFSASLSTPTKLSSGHPRPKLLSPSPRKGPWSRSSKISSFKTTSREPFLRPLSHPLLFPSPLPPAKLEPRSRSRSISPSPVWRSR